VIRPARRDDVTAITAFTQDTFAWGDYVPDRIEAWIDDPDNGLFVFADDDDHAVAVARAEMLSPNEAWFGALRVHPDHRGKRIATLLAAVLMDWARDRGSRVGRLLIEDWNRSSIVHVERIGMRRVGAVSYCERTVGDASPMPGGNGGRRVPASLRARPARAAEAEPAFASWAVGEIGRASRGLFGSQWKFRLLRPDDLYQAAQRGALWEIGTGWAMADMSGTSLEVGWLEVREENADQLIRALVDAATTRDAEQLVLWLPSLPWLIRAARKAGCDAEPMSIWEIAL